MTMTPEKRHIGHTRIAFLDSSLGRLTLVAEGDALQAILWPCQKASTPVIASLAEHSDTLINAAMTELNGYFSGKLKQFSVPLAPQGTAFQKAVWAALGRIAYGETQSYGDIANAVGRPSAARAVGAAIGKNPLSIITPCHRVIANNGQLTGFAGGLAAKEALLRLEGSWPRIKR